MQGEPLQALLWYVKDAPKSLVPIESKHHQSETKHSNMSAWGGHGHPKTPHMVTQAGKGGVGHGEDA